MSDNPRPMNAPGRPGLPRPAGAGPKAPRPARPLPQAPGPSAASLRLRAHLMIGILVTCVVLIGLIGWRVWRVLHPPTVTKVDVDTEFDKAMDQAKGASKDIFALETKVWGKNEELKAEDFTTIQSKLGELRECHDKVKDLLDLIHARGLDDSGSRQQIVPKWIQLKMWILDASDLLENQKPPEYGGLNIPMFLTSEKIRKAQEELKTINTTKDEIIQRNDPGEIKTVRKKIMDLREAFRGHANRLQELDKYVAEGLARPDLTNKEVMELDQLRDDANKAQMAVVAAGKILQAFPE
jgi:hypothetical protein